MTERHDDPSTLTGSYALDALSDEERAQVEAALASSPELLAETDSLRETALQLAYSTDPIEPPASLKASLMAQIQNTPQVAPAAPAASAPASAPVSSGAASSDAGREARPASAPSPASSVVPGPAETAARRRWFQRPAAALSAAAAVAVVFLGVGLGVGGVLSPAGESPRPGTSQGTSVLDGIYAASDFQRSSTPVQGGGTATVVWSQDLGKSAVILDGVEAAPKGKTYELWYIDSKQQGGAITPAGLMDRYADGVHSAVLTGKVRDGVTVGITVEPEGGSKQPTTTPIAAVPLDA